jgi:4a-hydroxytetrahydrobiopterin dehydratase
MSLTQQTCVPCQGGIPPLTPEEARGFLDQVPGWKLNDASDRLYRKFPFDDFVAALAFVNKVGAVAEEEGHHPDISFGWGHADIVLFTHKIQGLHENDFIMAAKISELG